MALYSNLNRSLYRCLRGVYNSLPKHCIQNIHEKPLTLEGDSLDDFTTQLVQRKTDKWSARNATKTVINKINVDKRKAFDCDIKYLNINRINSLFQQFIEIGDNSAVLELVAQCIKYRKCPSLSNLNYVLTLCAQNGDKTTITQIKELCGEFYPDILKANSNFNHYLAEAIWVKGNVTESLKLLKEVYVENAFLRRRIRLVFKYLVVNVISNRSEAALVNVVKFSESLLKDYKDFFPLTCIWQACFLSEWYTDQCLALDLLERNEGLCKAVFNQIPYVVAISLRESRTEVVYRLLEVLLKHEMESQYYGVLLALLDFQVHHGDVQSCLEIIQWSVKHNVELPTIHHEKFLELLLSCNIKGPNWKDKLYAIKKQKGSFSYKF